MYGLDGQGRPPVEGLPPAPDWQKWARQALRRLSGPTVWPRSTEEVSVARHRLYCTQHVSFCLGNLDLRLVWWATGEADWRYLAPLCGPVALSVLEQTIVVQAAGVA